MIKTETLIEAAGTAYQIRVEDIADERRAIAQLQAQTDERKGKVKTYEAAQVELLKAECLRLDMAEFSKLVAIDPHWSLVSVDGKYAQIRSSHARDYSVKEVWTDGRYSYEKSKLTGYYVKRTEECVRLRDGVIKGKQAGHNTMVKAADLGTAIEKLKAVTDAE